MTFKKLQELLKDYEKGDSLPTLGRWARWRLWRTVQKHWLAALESGAYKQARRVMRHNKTDFCCLGVLADILVPDSWEYTEKDNYWSHPINTGGCLNKDVWSVFAPNTLHQGHLTSANDGPDPGLDFDRPCRLIRKPTSRNPYDV